jgi:hypothetical protein
VALTLTATLTGATTSDLEIALDEVKRLTREGYQSGHSQNDSGSFTFSIDGHEEDPPPADQDEARTQGEGH